MRRSRVAVLSAAVGTAALFVALAPARGQNPAWVTVKGQITLTAAPKPAPINVTADQPHCLSKGPLIDDTIVVDPKTKGLKNVFVYILPEVKGDDGKMTMAKEWPKAAVNPALAGAKPKEHVIDQPCCQFEPRVVAAKAGDTLLVKNSSPVPHNINFNSDAMQFNPVIPPKGQFNAPKPLEAQRTPATFSCNIHPWMGGRMMVFDHPYFAVTDDSGKFEIKDVPAGTHRIVYRHESGFHKGRDGARGFTVATGAGPTLEMKPVDFELPPAK